MRTRIGSRRAGLALAVATLPRAAVHLRAIVRERARHGFSYSLDGLTFTPPGAEFTAKPGRWVGATIGVFALAPAGAAPRGRVDIDWFRIGR